MVDKDQLIAKFLTQSLSDEERLRFDELWAKDNSFKDEVALLQDLSKVAEYEDDSTTRDMIAGFEAEHHKKKSGASKIWWVAASIVLLISIAYFNTQDKPNTQDLFTENFEPYRNVVHPITRSVQREDLKTQAFS